MRNRKRTGWRRYINGINISAFFVVLFVGLPLYWLIASSFKTPANLGDSPPQYFPHPISLGNYTDAFKNNDFGQYFINSLIVTLVATFAGPCEGETEVATGPVAAAARSWRIS